MPSNGDVPVGAEVARFGLQDGFHDQLTSRIHHRDHDRCLTNVQPNILFIVHEGAPFVGSDLNAHPTPKGRPFIMRLHQLGRDNKGLALYDIL